MKRFFGGRGILGSLVVRVDKQGGTNDGNMKAVSEKRERIAMTKL